VPLGTYRGLRFGIVLNPQWSPEVYLEGATTRHDTLSRDHHGPRAVLNALDRLASAYGSEIASVRQELGIAEGQLRDYQARLGKPFPHDAYLSELNALRDQLKAGLSGASHEPDDKKGPSVSEIAAQIKELKATHNIEATPQRVRQKHSSAEEPVTARVRRRAEPMPASESAIEGETPAKAAGVMLSEPSQMPSANSPMPFQERMAIKRQRKSEGPPGPA
jgi:hypothetical protein